MFLFCTYQGPLSTTLLKPGQQRRLPRHGGHDAAHRDSDRPAGRQPPFTR